MDYSHILAVAAGVLVGVIAALKVIAPLTRNTVDDKVLEYAEKAEALVETVKPKPKA